MTQLLTTDNTDTTIADSRNIALLGFKMAVNEGLTTFNLVDGVVDEFHDESGTDEGEGSNDTYCASGDNYVNTTCTPISAGFAIGSVTEPQTSVTQDNPVHGTVESAEPYAKFTVPTGMTSVAMQAWGSGGGNSNIAEQPAAEAGAGAGAGAGAEAEAEAETAADASPDS